MNEAGIYFKISVSAPDTGSNINQTSSVIIPRRSDPVFYNPRQALNRDLSILALHTWNNLHYPTKTIVEAFAGTGIRALRYALQGPHFDKIYVNDVSREAVELCKSNFAYHADYLTQHHIKVEFLQQNCVTFFKKTATSEKNDRFDIIDLDPFGSPQPYLRSAIEVLGKSGMLAVTATDMPVITGLYPIKAYRRYHISGFRVRNRSYCHEVGLRMFIAYIQREGMSANPTGLLFPLLSFYSDHYIRLFFRRQKGGHVKSIYQHHGFLLDCHQCGTRQILHWIDSPVQPQICSNCPQVVPMLGPLYLGPLHDAKFLQEFITVGNKLLRKHPSTFDRKSRIKRFLPLLAADLESDSAWFYDLDWLGRRFNTSLPATIKVVEYLKKQSYQASLTHFSGRGIKTDAPLERILNTFRNELREL